MLSNESENPDSISKDNGYRRRFHMSQTWSAERSLVAALLLSLAVNALQFLDARRADGIQPRRLSAAAVPEKSQEESAEWSNFCRVIDGA